MAVGASYLFGLLGGSILVVLGWSLVRRRVSVAQARARRAGRGLVDLFGPLGAATAVALAGMTAVKAVLWPIGVMLSRQESSLDRPVYRWMRDRQAPGSWWWDLNLQISDMGNNGRTKLVVVASCVLLGLLWRRRAWWIPPLAIGGTYLGERFGQQLLKVAVHRGHPRRRSAPIPQGAAHD